MKEEIKGMKQYRDRCVKLMSYILKHYDEHSVLTKIGFLKLIEEVSEKTK
jgi:hypothetical protein|tara:strand:- start:1977 stop:2126 length:150 start_codon:yes stop_codon:yes gene_type:complete